LRDSNHRIHGVGKVKYESLALQTFLGLTSFIDLEITPTLSLTDDVNPDCLYSKPPTVQRPVKGSTNSTLTAGVEKLTNPNAPPD